MATVTVQDILSWPKPNHINPTSRVPLLLGFEIPLSIIMTSFVSVRMYVRYSKKTVGWDDWTMLIAWACIRACFLVHWTNIMIGNCDGNLSVQLYLSTLGYRTACMGCLHTECDSTRKSECSSGVAGLRREYVARRLTCVVGSVFPTSFPALHRLHKNIDMFDILARFSLQDQQVVLLLHNELRSWLVHCCILRNHVSMLVSRPCIPSIVRALS